MLSSKIFYLAIPAIIVLLSLQPVQGRMSVILDKASDIFRSWSLNGDYDYIPNGIGLKSKASSFPEKFNFKPFYLTKGIWCVFPLSADLRLEEFGKPASNVTSATFGFRSAAQLLDSVSISYSMGGKTANITISSGFNKEPIMTISSSSMHIEDGFVKAIVPLNIATNFVIEANVSSDGDYILIDQIEAIFLETTTSTRPTTTTTPTPLPKSAASNFSPVLILLSSSILFILSHL